MDRKLRDLVWRRAESRCEYCQMPQEFDPPTFEIDHIIARKHHGETTATNLSLSCLGCNSHKGPNLSGRDSETGSVVPLFHPRKDDWDEHFEWHGAVLVGRTPAGRATVDVLCINLPYRIALRAALISEGVFPPIKS